MLEAGIADGSVLPSDPRVVEALTWLVKLPEHTYGSNDGKIASDPWDNVYFDAHVNDSDFQITRDGYMDQRAYLNKTVAALGALPVAAAIAKALEQSEPIMPLSYQGLELWPTYTSDVLEAGGLRLQLSEHGGLGMVTEISTGVQWASGNNPLGLFRYRTHSEAEFDDWGRR